MPSSTLDAGSGWHTALLHGVAIDLLRRRASRDQDVDQNEAEIEEALGHQLLGQVNAGVEHHGDVERDEDGCQLILC